MTCMLPPPISCPCACPRVPACLRFIVHKGILQVVHELGGTSGVRNALVVVIALIVCLSLMFETYAHLLLDAQLAQLCCGHCTGVWAALVLTHDF